MTSKAMDEVMRKNEKKIMDALYGKSLMDYLAPKQAKFRGLFVDDPFSAPPLGVPFDSVPKVGEHALDVDLKVLIKEIEANARQSLNYLNKKIDGLTKELADLKKKRDDFEVRRMRGVPERPDYGNWFSDDEDGLEEGYRGWPIPKDKVIF
jgi:hypothetical protein